MNKKIAIIIVNWNGKRLLKTCLKAVFDQTYKNFDVYFVDNGSEDGSGKFVENKFPKTKIIKLKENTGFAKGNNVGIKKAFEDKKVEYIVCLNNDTKVDKNWLKELVKPVQQNEKIGMVASKAFSQMAKFKALGCMYFLMILNHQAESQEDLIKNQINLIKKNIFLLPAVVQLYTKERL